MEQIVNRNGIWCKVVHHGWRIRQYRAKATGQQETIAYARVSTSEQETALQIDALRRAGVRKIFQEKASSVGSRPQLRRLLDVVAPGDVLVVWKIDRVARSLRDLLMVLEALNAGQVGFRSLTEPIDTSTPIGEFICQILGAVAQLERSIIRERSIAGQVAYLQRGGIIGRRRKLSDTEELEMFCRFVLGEKRAAIVDDFGVSLSVMDRVVREHVGQKKTGTGPVLSRYLALA
jgi:DNA invertase Pin-like site-specific DNA recombinase